VIFSLKRLGDAQGTGLEELMGGVVWNGSLQERFGEDGYGTTHNRYTS
jgi:hypothetical protein